jgi:drug/metabolite transporter (DMT)-like permease
MKNVNRPFELTGSVGTAALICTAVCFGLVPLFARELQAAGVGSPVIALSRYMLSAVVLLPFLPRGKAKRRAACLLSGAGMGMGVAMIGYVEALKTVPVGTAGVIYMSYPVFVLLFAWLLTRQRTGKRAIASAALILMAAVVAYASGEFTVEAQWALMLALPAPITFGLAIAVLCTCTHGLSPIERMACAMLGAAVGLAPIALISDSSASVTLWSTEVWLLLGGMALVTALIPQYVYSVAAPGVGPARAAAAGAAELPTMMVVGWLAFGEVVGDMDLLAAVLVMVAVGIAPAIAAQSSTERNPGKRTLLPRQLATSNSAVGANDAAHP